MATDVTKSIGSGLDYATITAFIAAVPTDITSSNERWIGEVYGEIAETTINITGKTTSSTCYIYLRPGTNQGFGDNTNKSTNALRYNSSNGAAVSLAANGVTAIVVGCQYTLLEGLQFKHTLSPGTGATIYINSSGANTTIRDCIVENHSSGLTINSALVHSDVTASYINCLFVFRLATAGEMVRSSANRAVSARNCTLVALSSGAGTTQAFSFQNTSTPTDRIITNCAVFGFDVFADDLTQYNAASGYNATDLSAALTGTSGDVTSLTLADQFESVATDGSHDLRAKSGSGLAVGARDETYTSDLDIVGRARSTGTPTIGAWELILAGGASRRLLLGVG